MMSDFNELVQIDEDLLNGGVVYLGAPCEDISDQLIT